MVDRRSKAPTRRPQQRRSVATVSKLLDAVGRVVAREGALGVTRASVAAESGLSGGAVYRYFRSPASLTAAWEARMWEGATRALVEHACSLPPTLAFPDAALALALAAADTVARTARTYRFGPGDAVLLSAPDERLAWTTRAVELLSATLAERQRDVLPSNHRLAASLVIEACVAVAFAWATDRAEEVDSGRFQREMAHLLACYLSREAPAPPELTTAVPEPLRASHRSSDGGHEAGGGGEGGGVQGAGTEKEPRKAPQQARSVETVAILVEATRRVLAREGLAGVTTTRVAAEAGVSVGTLYQYFPTKEALVAAWEERMLEAILHDFSARVGVALAREAERGPLGVHGAYAVAYAAVDSLARNAQAYRFSPGEMALSARSTRKLELADGAAAALRAALEHEGPQMIAARRLDAAALLVVSAAVLLSFAWPSEHPEQVASGEFQHELATMVVRYLAKEPGTTPYGAATPAPSTP